MTLSDLTGAGAMPSSFYYHPSTTSKIQPTHYSRAFYEFWPTDLGLSTQCALQMAGGGLGDVEQSLGT